MARTVAAAAAAGLAAVLLLAAAALLSGGSDGVQTRRLGAPQDGASGVVTRVEPGLYLEDYFGEEDPQVGDRRLAEDEEEEAGEATSEAKSEAKPKAHHSHHKRHNSSHSKNKVELPLFMEGPLGTTRCPPEYTRIVSEATCRVAAKALKKTWNEIVSREWTPAGCYTSSYWVTFNTHKSGGAKEEDAPICEKVGVRKVTLGGFPSEVNSYDRSFLNGMFVERPGPAYIMNKRATYWKDKGQLYLYHCKKYSDWRVGVASDWEHNLAGDCMSFAYTQVGEELFDPSHVQFTHIWDGSAWSTIMGAGVVQLEPEPLGAEVETQSYALVAVPAQAPAVKEPAATAFGFSAGQSVTWLSEDQDVPKNTTGTVVGFTPDRVRVRFPAGTWRFMPEEIRLAKIQASADPCGHCYYHSDSRVTAHEKGGCKAYSRDPTKCVNNEESETCSLTPDLWWGPCTTNPDESVGQGANPALAAVAAAQGASEGGGGDHVELGPKERKEMLDAQKAANKASKKKKKASASSGDDDSKR